MQAYPENGGFEELPPYESPAPTVAEMRAARPSSLIRDVATDSSMKMEKCKI
jgi:hypothetical protein